MGFVKYEAPEKLKPLTPDVKIGPLGISINREAAAKYGLVDITHVNLWFDADTNAIAITASAVVDKSAFKLTPRGRSKDILFIAAARFYAKFEIAIDEKGLTSNLSEAEGKPAFHLPTDRPAIAVPSGKRRGRKPKV